MQREDVERLADSLDTFARHYPGLAKDAANALRALLAERDALRAAIFGDANYATDLANGNFIEMAQATEAARLGALARAEKAEAERDALQGQLNDLRNGWANSVKAHAALLAERDADFAAGQESMRGRAAKAAEMAFHTGAGANDLLAAHNGGIIMAQNHIRALPIKPRTEQN